MYVKYIGESERTNYVLPLHLSICVLLQIMTKLIKTNVNYYILYAYKNYNFEDNFFFQKRIFRKHVPYVFDFKNQSVRIRASTIA